MNEVYGLGWIRRLENSGFEELNLDDYRVCKLLQPVTLDVASKIEAHDVSVGRYELTKDWIRVYPDYDRDPSDRDRINAIFPLGYLEESVPDGLLEKAIDLSYGSTFPFPETIGEDEQRFIGKLMRFLFPKNRPRMIAHIWLNAASYGVLQKHSKTLSKFHGIDSVKSGFYGTLHETESAKSNHVIVGVSRDVPVGSVAVIKLCSTAIEYEVTTHVL